jgi:predicted lipoprotein with Yx(FWY)xxD motif
MNTIKISGLLLPFAAALLLLASACGGGGDSGAEPSAQDGSSTTSTVSVGTVDGVGDVLVDAGGAALYAADQEANGMVRCTDSCADTWDPLTVSDGDQPTAASVLAGKLGVVQRPDGSQQVTFGGRPLYRFVEDPAPGTVTGNGFADSFAGQDFTWHVVTPTGVSTSAANSSASDGYGS